jgi:hypothetical protein
MLFHQMDRFGRHKIKVGDQLKLPADLPRPLNSKVDAPYRHGTFEVVAFPVRSAAFMDGRNGSRDLAHCIVVRRLCDGFTTTVAAHYWKRVMEAYFG